MVSVLILVFVSILVLALIGIAWGANARKRAGQSGRSDRTTPDASTTGRASGPD
jgi:hypothetical protein